MSNYRSAGSWLKRSFSFTPEPIAIAGDFSERCFESLASISPGSFCFLFIGVLIPERNLVVLLVFLFRTRLLTSVEISDISRRGVEECSDQEVIPFILCHVFHILKSVFGVCVSFDSKLNKTWYSLNSVSRLLKNTQSNSYETWFESLAWNSNADNKK